VKKYASILAVFVLLLGLAALSYAAPAEIPSDTTAVIAKGKTQITLGGELRFRGLMGKNLKVTNDKDDPFTASTSAGAAEGTTSYYDYRVRLSLEAKVSPNTTGFVEIESGTSNSDNITGGSGTDGAKGVYRYGNKKSANNLSVRQAWIQYQGTGLLGVPAGVKVGHQLIKLGNGLFFDHTYYGDDAILVFVQPLKELTLAAHTIKFDENNVNQNDDVTAYGILAAYTGKGWGLSADITYIDHQQYNTNVPLHLWNIGLRGNVDDIASTGLGFRADVEFQTGKVDYTTQDDLKLKGWAVLAGLDYKFKSIPLTLTAEYAIGSGDKDSNDNKDQSFITSLGNEQHYTFVYEYLTPSACNFLGSTSHSNNRTGLCNTQYVKIGGSYDITKDLNVKLYGYWLRAHKAVAINSDIGTGTAPSTDKDLGYEVDAYITYQIDKNLTYFVESGYFWPGDAWKLKGGKDADDAWAVRHGITLKF